MQRAKVLYVRSLKKLKSLLLVVFIFPPRTGVYNLSITMDEGTYKKKIQLLIN